VYNEAGELVKVLLLADDTQPILTFDLGPDNLIQSLYDQVDLLSSNGVIGSWDGRTGSGELASNGVYHVKVDNVDPMGAVTTATQQVVVDRRIYRMEVTIYNAAGEAVRRLAQTLSDPGPAGLTGVTLTSSVIQPGALGGTIPTQLGIALSSGTTITWDGRADNGTVVATGRYFVEVHVSDGQGGDQQITHAVTVEGKDGKTGAGIVTTDFNALSATDPIATFNATGAGVTALRLRVYTAAGELVVPPVQGPPGSVTFDGRTVASGLYFAVVEVLDAQGLLTTNILKLSVMF
jgi:hypothetical protein